MNVVDLGCGSGNLTMVLHKHLNARKTLGIDSSSEMLAECPTSMDPNLTFQKVDVMAFSPMEKFDVVFSNACLQWVPGHLQLFEVLAGMLTNTGQLAIQMPYNSDYATHVIARELAEESPYKETGLVGLRFNVLLPEVYTELFYRLGFKKQIVRMQVYPHILESTESVIEWVKGSMLTYYQKRLPAPLFEKFLAEYRKRVVACLGDSKPVLLPFKRAPVGS